MSKSLKDFYVIPEVDSVRTIAIASACSDDIDLACEAVKIGIARFIFIGNAKSINEKLVGMEFPKDMYDVVAANSEHESASLMMKLIQDGSADIPMKGLMQTGTFMKAILESDQGLRTSQLISQITIFEGINNKLQLLTDCAVNIEPDLKSKIGIINNAVEIAVNLGLNNPKVALLGSVETVNPRMLDTMESAVITQMNRRNQISGCTIDGPLALDNAISFEAAKKKGIQSDVAGNADILVAPNLLVSNTLSKAITYYANKESASVIAGTKRPVVMTSRTDRKNNKLNSIAIACYLHTKL